MKNISDVHMTPAQIEYRDRVINVRMELIGLQRDCVHVPYSPSNTCVLCAICGKHLGQACKDKDHTICEPDDNDKCQFCGKEIE